MVDNGLHQITSLHQRLAPWEVDGWNIPGKVKRIRSQRPLRPGLWEGGGQPLTLISTHLVSVSPKKGSDSHPLPKRHLGNKAGNVFHLGPRIQLSLQQWVAFKPNI